MIKLVIMLNSNIFQEQVLKLFPEWTVESIRQRREEIKSWALERWKIGANHVAPSPVDQTSQPIQDPVDRDERRRQDRQRFVDRAYQLGNGVEFEALLETLGRFPLYCYLNRKYQGINFTLPENRTSWVVWVGPDLYVHVDFEKLAQVTGVSIQDVAQLLDPARRTLQRSEVSNYIGCLEKILALRAK